ncbi:unnamed protein product [Diamesa tonsa]
MPTGTSGLNKCNKKADLYRTNGNQLYSQKKFFDALIAYNQSLCHAEIGAESMGLALANRSAVFLECNLYENALQNIKLAVENKYPESKHEILNKRKQKCMEQLKVPNKPEEDPWNFLKLSYPANEKLPFIVDCVQLQCDDKYGRYITTNRALKVGDIVAIEKPFCKIIKCDARYSTCYESNCYQRCSHCLKENFLDLYPCEGCNLTMFCSEECKDLANRKYHYYECEIMKALQFSGTLQMSLRSFFMALSLFDKSINIMEQELEKIKNSSVTVFDFNFSKSNNPDNDMNLLLSAYALCQSDKKFPLDAHAAILNKHSKLKDVWKTHEMFIRNFLLRHAQISDSNFHGIYACRLKKEDLTNMNSQALFNELQETIASGCFPFLSLLNHSCAPNVIRTNVQGKVAIVVLRPLAAGDQLFDCYSANFNTHSRSERQSKLYREFYFKCECEACSLNFPAPPTLKTIDIKVLRYAKKMEDDLINLQQHQLKKKFSDICNAIEKSSPHFPCCDISLLQKCFAIYFLCAARPAFQFA